MPLAPALEFGLGGEDDEITELAVGDEDLLAIDDEIVAVANCLRAHRFEVAARVRFGHAERADRLALDHLRKPLPLLLLGPEGEDISSDQICMDQKSRSAGADAPQLLEDDDVEEIVEPKAAVLLGDRAAQHADFAGLAPEFARHDAVVFPLRMERYDLFLDKAPDRRAPDLMIFAE